MRKLIFSLLMAFLIIASVNVSTNAQKNSIKLLRGTIVDSSNVPAESAFVRLQSVDALSVNQPTAPDYEQYDAFTTTDSTGFFYFIGVPRTPTGVTSRTYVLTPIPYQATVLNPYGCASYTPQYYEFSAETTTYVYNFTCNH